MYCDHKQRFAQSPQPNTEFRVPQTQMERNKSMFLIVGLGNPTKQYEKTRHNIGFDVMDALADKYNISISEKKHKALCGKGVIEGTKVRQKC